MTKIPPSTGNLDLEQILGQINSLQAIEDKDFNEESVKSNLLEKFGLNVDKMRFKRTSVNSEGETVTYWYPVVAKDKSFIKGSNKEKLIIKARFLLGISRAYQTVAEKADKGFNEAGKFTFYKTRKSQFEYLKPVDKKLDLDADSWKGRVQNVFFKTIGFNGSDDDYMGPGGSNQNNNNAQNAVHSKREDNSQEIEPELKRPAKLNGEAKSQEHSLAQDRLQNKPLPPTPTRLNATSELVNRKTISQSKETAVSSDDESNDTDGYESADDIESTESTRAESSHLIRDSLNDLDKKHSFKSRLESSKKNRKAARNLKKNEGLKDLLKNPVQASLNDHKIPSSSAVKSKTVTDEESKDQRVQVEPAKNTDHKDIPANEHVSGTDDVKQEKNKTILQTTRDSLWNKVSKLTNWLNRPEIASNDTNDKEISDDDTQSSTYSDSETSSTSGSDFDDAQSLVNDDIEQESKIAKIRQDIGDITAQSLIRLRNIFAQKNELEPSTSSSEMSFSDMDDASFDTHSVWSASSSQENLDKLSDNDTASDYENGSLSSNSSNSNSGSDLDDDSIFRSQSSQSNQESDNDDFDDLVEENQPESFVQKIRNNAANVLNRVKGAFKYPAQPAQPDQTLVAPEVSNTKLDISSDSDESTDVSEQSSSSDELSDSDDLAQDRANALSLANSIKGSIGNGATVIFDRIRNLFPLASQPAEKPIVENSETISSTFSFSSSEDEIDLSDSTISEDETMAEPIKEPILEQGSTAPSTFQSISNYVTKALGNLQSKMPSLTKSFNAGPALDDLVSSSSEESLDSNEISLSESDSTNSPFDDLKDSNNSEESLASEISMWPEVPNSELETLSDNDDTSAKPVIKPNTKPVWPKVPNTKLETSSDSDESIDVSELSSSSDEPSDSNDLAQDRAFALSLAQSAKSSIGSGAKGIYDRIRNLFPSASQPAEEISPTFSFSSSEDELDLSDTSESKVETIAEPLLNALQSSSSKESLASEMSESQSDSELDQPSLKDNSPLDDRKDSNISSSSSQESLASSKMSSSLERDSEAFELSSSSNISVSNNISADEYQDSDSTDVSFKSADSDSTNSFESASENESSSYSISDAESLEENVIAQYVKVPRSDLKASIQNYQETSANERSKPANPVNPVQLQDSLEVIKKAQLKKISDSSSDSDYESFDSDSEESLKSVYPTAPVAPSAKSLNVIAAKLKNKKETISKLQDAINNHNGFDKADNIPSSLAPSPKELSPANSDTEEAIKPSLPSSESLDDIAAKAKARKETTLNLQKAIKNRQEFNKTDIKPSSLTPSPVDSSPVNSDDEEAIKPSLPSTESLDDITAKVNSKKVAISKLKRAINNRKVTTEFKKPSSLASSPEIPRTYVEGKVIGSPEVPTRKRKPNPAVTSHIEIPNETQSPKTPVLDGRTFHTNDVTTDEDNNKPAISKALLNHRALHERMLKKHEEFTNLISDVNKKLDEGLKAASKLQEKYDDRNLNILEENSNAAVQKEQATVTTTPQDSPKTSKQTSPAQSDNSSSDEKVIVTIHTPQPLTPPNESVSPSVSKSFSAEFIDSATPAETMSYPSDSDKDSSFSDTSEKLERRNSLSSLEELVVDKNLLSPASSIRGSTLAIDKSLSHESISLSNPATPYELSPEVQKRTPVHSDTESISSDESLKDDKISSQFSSQSSTPTIERVAPYFVESSSEESIVPAATTPKVVSPVISPAQSDTKVVAPVIESLQPYIKTVEPLTAAVTDPLLNKFSVPSFVLPTAPVIQPNIEKIVPYVNPLADKTSSAPKTVIGMEDYNVGEASSNEFVPNTIVDKELEELEELERQAIADSLREFKYSQPNLPSGSSILPKKPSLKTEVTSDETIIPEGKQEVTPLTEPISLADQELLDMEKAIALSLQDDPTNKVLDKIASLTNDSKPSVKPEPSVFNLEKLGEGKSLDSAQKQWSNPVTNEDKITYKTRFDNYNKIKSYSESNKINLAFREVKGDGNCGISSFLLTLFNKLSRSELITEFKHYTNTGIDPVKYEKVLAKYKKLSISAFSTFKNLENDPSKTIDDNSIKILSHWLRFRILVESLICHNDPVKKSSSEFFATEHNMRDFVDNFFNDPKNKNVKKVKSLLANFSVAISTLDNPINIEHLMLLGSSFNHSVTVFNIDGIGDNAIIKYNTIPGKDLHLVLKGGNQDSAHFDALLKR